MPRDSPPTCRSPALPHLCLCRPPSGAPDPAPRQVVPVTPLSGSAGMEVAAAPDLGCISNRVTIPFSPGHRVVSPRWCRRRRPDRSRLRSQSRCGWTWFPSPAHLSFANRPVGPTMAKDAASVPVCGWVGVSPSRYVALDPGADVHTLSSVLRHRPVSLVPRGWWAGCSWGRARWPAGQLPWRRRRQDNRSYRNPPVPRQTNIYPAYRTR